MYIDRLVRIAGELVPEADILSRGRVVLILAEPGAGKTRLLGSLGRMLSGISMTATHFRHRTISNSVPSLLIDGLDEVARTDRTALDEMIIRISEATDGPVVMVSRSSEWDEASTRRAREVFECDPVLVRLEPLHREEQRLLFREHRPEEDFDTFISECCRVDLDSLLGNPQFLILFAAAFAKAGGRITSKQTIFAMAIEQLASERNPDVRTRERPPVRAIVAAASDIMAKLLLSGASGVSATHQGATVDHPFLIDLSAGFKKAALSALGSGLFSPNAGMDIHAPVHRIVAEYCAATHIVDKVADPARPASLRRILSVVAPNGVVRDDLRGLLGWLASIGPERIQQATIDIDPYAVLANGDPSRLLPASRLRLLRRLGAVAADNPGFRRTDSWRNFSVAGFFTRELVPEMRHMLSASTGGSQLRSLLMQLLAISGGPRELTEDCRTILLDVGADDSSRIWAARSLSRLNGLLPSPDLCSLVDEGSTLALRIASEAIWENRRTSSDFGDMACVLDVHAFGARNGQARCGRHDGFVSHYLHDVIDDMEALEAAGHLNRLSVRLSLGCDCAGDECWCRIRASKLAVRLLDRYLDALVGPPDPARLWRWLREMRFSRGVDGRLNSSVRILRGDDGLRRCLLERLVTELTDGARPRRTSPDERHSGLAFCSGDDLWLVDHAFENGDAELWRMFHAPHRARTKSRTFDALRRRLREQSRLDPQLGAIWALQERMWKEMQGGHKRSRRRYARSLRRNASVRREPDPGAELAEKRLEVAAGLHRDWSVRMARQYLGDVDPTKPWTTDPDLVKTTLRAALERLRDHAPGLDHLAVGRGWDRGELAFAACWLRFQERGSLEGVPASALPAAKVFAHRRNHMPTTDFERFENELDRILFPSPGHVERFARALVEPGLAGSRHGATYVAVLRRPPFSTRLSPTLPMEWLRRYPTMPPDARHDLFEIAAVTNGRSELLDLVDAVLATLRLAVPVGDGALEFHVRDLRFWRVRRFLLEPAEPEGGTQLADDPDTIFILSDLLEKASRTSDVGNWADLSSRRIERILRAYAGVWPKVHLPSSWGTGSPPGERAYRYLDEIAWRIGRLDPDEAVEVADRLLKDARFHDFADALRTKRAESLRRLAHGSVELPSTYDVAAMFEATGVASVEDLRALVVEALEWLQGWLRSSATNPIAAYHNEDGTHVDENTARDRVVDSLSERLRTSGLTVAIEHNMANGRRCDFAVSAPVAGQLRLLVVEAKGQWHRDLHTAASTQLELQYSSHMDAEGQGIYLVFWFGSGIPVAGRRSHGIASASQLKEHLEASLPERLRTRVDIFVLDLARRA